MSKEKKTYSIYSIRNKTNGKRYIGLSCQVTIRINQHRRSNRTIGVIIRKYGWSNFSIRVLNSNLTLRQAKITEQKYIAKYNCMEPNGYNGTNGGQGRILSDITRLKISKALTGRKRKPFSNKARTNMSKASKESRNRPEVIAKFKQTNSQPKVKARRSKAAKECQNRPEVRAEKIKRLTGRKLSTEHRANIGKAQIGKKHSSESIEKTRQAHLGSKRSKETCRKISEALKGKTRTIEIRAKMSKARKGTKFSDKHKANLSASLKKAHNTPEMKKLHSEWAKKQHSDPEKKEKHRKAVKEGIKRAKELKLQIA